MSEHNCTKCQKEIIDKQCAVVDTSKYHVACFNCNACSKSLAGQKFNKKDGEVYCEACHLEKHAPTCDGCQRKLAGKHLIVESKRFHNDCFVCAFCTTPFGTDGYFQDEDKRFSCKKCLTLKRNRECGHCKEVIHEDEIFAMEQYFHQECFKCQKCDKPLGDASFINQEGKPYHSTCVNSTCIVCGDQCDGEYYQVENDDITHIMCVGFYKPQIHNKQVTAAQKSDTPALIEAVANIQIVHTSEPKQEEAKEQPIQQQQEQQQDQQQKQPTQVQEKPYEAVQVKPANCKYELKVMEVQDVNTLDPKCLDDKRVRYTLAELRVNPPPAGVPINKKELFLSDSDFEKLFKMTVNRFLALKDWKQISLKKQNNLF